MNKGELIAALDFLAEVGSNAQDSLTMYINSYERTDMTVMLRSPPKYRKHGARRGQGRMQWERQR